MFWRLLEAAREHHYGQQDSRMLKQLCLFQVFAVIFAVGEASTGKHVDIQDYYEQDVKGDAG